MNRSRSQSAPRGFSAVEMLVVLGILGMMLLITAPQLFNFYNSMKVRTAAHRLMSHARLCRQAAVARRTPVMLELQRTEGSTPPSYRAWEERNNNLVRNANGVDGTVNTIDDERWVVKEETGLARDKVVFVDSYDDITPSDPNDAVGSSIMNGSGILRLKFFPTGQVLRIDDDGDEINTDTLIRMRMQRQISGSRTDRWDITMNRVGKVSSDFKMVPP